jgi:hypothetical protein
MSRRLLILGLLSSILALSGEGTAAAQPLAAPLIPAHHLGAKVGSPVAAEPQVHTGFVLDPPGPYEIGVRTAGDAVVVTVVRRSRRRSGAAADYLARGVATPERLRASFGRFGKISMHFRESRHRPWFGKRRRCHGAGRFVSRRGVFVGNFRFRGEDGYVAVHVHRAKGSISSLASKCRRREQRRSDARSSSLLEDPFSDLIAIDRNGLDSTVFAAISYRGRLEYFAEREENRGRLAILRAAVVEASGELPLNEAVTAGRFAPGSPFHGAGRYRAAPDGSTSWSGNLSVDFPGAPRFPLAGPGYETFLEAAF